MTKTIKFYRAEVPEICGYSAIGYGITPMQAITACKKSYTELTKEYRKDWDSHQIAEFGTFKKAWEYFGASLVEQIAGDHATEGNENTIEAEKYL